MAGDMDPRTFLRWYNQGSYENPRYTIRCAEDVCDLHSEPDKKHAFLTKNPGYGLYVCVACREELGLIGLIGS